ncbi:MAG: M17 family peptidase N-terminal domain-containing protein, partial [Pseudomonadota bacterium]
MKIAFSKAAAPAGVALIVPAFEDGEPSAAQAALDAATSGALGKALKAANFTGKKAQSLELIG